MPNMKTIFLGAVVVCIGLFAINTLASEMPSIHLTISVANFGGMAVVWALRAIFEYFN